MARHHPDSPEALQAQAEKEQREAEQKRADARSEKQAKVGDDPSKPPDADHLPTAPGTPADAPAPLTAEHFDDPAQVYEQNPPPQGVGPWEQKTPPTVHPAPGSVPPAVDARGFPVEPPKPEGYQQGTLPPDAE